MLKHTTQQTANVDTDFNSDSIRNAAIPIQWLGLTTKLNIDELVALSEEVIRCGVAKDDLNKVRQVWTRLHSVNRLRQPRMRM